MIRSELQNFGVTIDVPFNPAIALLEARLNDFSTRLIDPQRGFSLRPDQIRLKHSDILYGYELTALFFGGNAVIQRTAEHVELRLTGGKTATDSEIVFKTIEKFRGLLEEFDAKGASVWAHGHASFASAEQAGQFFSQYMPRGAEGFAGAVFPGALGFVTVSGWPYEIRVSIEPSKVFQDAAFVSFNTVMQLDDAEAGHLHSLSASLGVASTLFGLEIALLP